MSDETTEDQAQPPDEDNLLRTLWPHDPHVIGIAVLTTTAEVGAINGMTDEEREPLILAIERGARILVIESEPDAQGEMLALLTSALQGSRLLAEGRAKVQ